MSDHQIYVTLPGEEPDPAIAEYRALDVEITARLKSEPGAVIHLGTDFRDDGVAVFTAGLNSIPGGCGYIRHVMAEHYPRIVGALKAQGCRVKPDSILTLVSNWDNE